MYKGSNSGILYLAQEVTSKDKDGNDVLEPIYISAPEYQILDNANHPDAKLGKDNNRQSASLYDMIPAVPQNSKPFGEWNKAKIMVYKGTVVHGQNDENVLEYHLWEILNENTNPAPSWGTWAAECEILEVNLQNVMNGNMTAQDALDQVQAKMTEG